MQRGRDKLSDMANAIQGDKVTRFNISRAYIWEGIRRAILKKSFVATSTVLVKFMDDIGVSEEAVDQGGPRRELLQLAIHFLKHDSQLFVGSTEKFLSLTQSGTLKLYLDLFSLNFRISSFFVIQ